MMPAEQQERSESPIRAHSGNSRNRFFNTVTAAMWKGEASHASPLREESTRRPANVIAASDLAGISEEDGFPFPADDVAGDVSTNRLMQVNQEQAGMPILALSGAVHPSAMQDSDGTSISRPNVQFAESSAASQGPALTQEYAVPSPLSTNERPSHARTTSLLSKFRSLTPSSHIRNVGGGSSNDNSVVDGTVAPLARDRRGIYRARPRSFAGEADADADIEDSGREDIATTLSPRRPQDQRRLLPNERGEEEREEKEEKDKEQLQGPPRLCAEPSSAATSPSRPRRFPTRRATTMTEISENQRQGVSEDEGRDRLARGLAWKRRSSAWLGGGQHPGYTSPRRQSGHESSDGARPKSRRFFSSRAGASSATDEPPSRLRKPRGETRALEKWQKFRTSLKLIVQKTKEDRINEAKSAELMAELLAGTPAALILASSFQRDEGDKKRIPVLLEQLKISITKSFPIKDDSGDRHQLFHIELEYGSGLMRMKWTIDRTLRDFINLHFKFKLQSGKQKYQRRGGDDSARTKLPRFPRSAFPILRGVRGLADEDEEEDDTADEGEGMGDQIQSARRPKNLKKRTSSQHPYRRQLSDPAVAGSTMEPNQNGAVIDASNALHAAKDNYNTRQRKKLEIYLRELIRFVTFRAGSNRICRFLELSALGVRLASESTFHGKEGTLVLRSGKGVDFRKALKPSLFITRHKPMWFLVRQSYLVYVDSPEEMNVYDVFLIDNAFEVQSKRPRLRDQNNFQELTKTAKTQARHPSHHVLRLHNSERQIKLLAKNERQLQQFQASLEFVKSTTDWANKNRFDSFAPLRKNVFAQWLVDGRDYMWNLSRAVSMAQDVIYIHDWWLSPELYTRRPAAISHKWRLDRLLRRKAEEGVKIFVIVYRNINSAIPIDSEYTKFSLLELHPNVFVQRSPNQFRQNTFFWAHHEKLCVVDHTIAFCGGVDLCYGRWDTPQHPVVDDKPTGFEPNDTTPRDADHCQLWPGKDYSNPRVLDFFKLDEPYGEMYDRAKVPRMPWHDIGMQIVGQPARDLTRHFTQRWNYILRQRKPSRPTPFLLPPPDFGPNELEALGLDGTCEIQMLRSACDWSIGTPNKVEHSIMTAYCSLISRSDHFVYIENQFFISSCVVEGTRIRNQIGDALVDRIIRAHAQGEDWRAIIVIPLMPGFQNTVDAQDGTSVRLIMQCQYRSIDRGETSIFGRLQALGIEPTDYVEFYSLRAWGKIGPSKALVTEQLYIHAKAMVVDDRYAIIGSANINERSMLGERDSEIAAVISDTDMIDSYMGGAPYKVGRFPHTLRMRLMREHLGIDVDEVMAEERDDNVYGDDGSSADDELVRPLSSRSDRSTERKLIAVKHKTQDALIAKAEQMHSFNHDVDWAQANNPNLIANKKITADARVTGNEKHTADVDGFGFDNMAAISNGVTENGRDTVLLKCDREVLVNNLSPEDRGTLVSPAPVSKSHQRRMGSHSNSQDDDDSMTTIAVLPPSRPQRLTTREMGLTLLSQLPALPIGDDTDIGGPPVQQTFSSASAEQFSPLLASMRRPVVDKDCMKDPLNDPFFRDTWHAVAQNNTKLYRQVFRCMPDSRVKNWKEYESAVDYAERFAQSQGMSKSTQKMQQETHGKTGPPGTGASVLSAPLASIKQKKGGAYATADPTQHGLSQRLTAAMDRENHSHNEKGDETSAIRDHDYSLNEKEQLKSADSAARIDFAESNKDSADTFNEKQNLPNGDTSSADGQQHGTLPRQRARTATKSSGHGPDAMPNREDAEKLLKLIQGHLIEWPYDWLIQEERGGKWLYSIDLVAPLEIYN